MTMDERAVSKHAGRLIGWLSADGATGQRMRGMDWSQTPLGAIEKWPPHLQLALNVCLDSGFAAAIYWGGEFTLFHNDAYAAFLGGKHSHALGKPAREVWLEMPDGLMRELKQVVDLGEAIVHSDHLCCLQRHGYREECYFDLALSPVRGPKGEVDGVFKTLVETTGRVLATRRTACLRDLAECLVPAQRPGTVCELAAQTLARANADVPFAILYLADEDGRSARLAGAAGLAADSTACPPSVPLDVPESAPWPLAAAARTGQPQAVATANSPLAPLPGGAWPEPVNQVMILPCIAETGSPCAFLVAGVSPRRAFDDDYLGFLQLAARSIGSAVTSTRCLQAERLRLEAERAEILRTGEERLRYLTEAADIGCWDWDVVADRGVCTDRCRAIFNLPPDKPLSYVCFLGMLHPEDRARTDAAMQRALANGGDYDVEYRVVWPDGSEHWVESKGRVDFGPDDQPRRMAGIVVDITERKAGEAALKAHKVRLEEEVEARTMELKAANRELQAFTYGVAHDLKSPLRGIISYSQLLAMEYRDSLAGAGAEFLDQIQKSVARMRALIDDLLAYSRVEHAQLNVQPLELAAAIRRVLAERADDIRRAGVQVRTNLPSIRILGDPEGVAQVLRNLVDNALKFSIRASPPVIEIGGEALGSHCRLWVRDNGLGFDMAEHDRIFQIFQRLHRADDIPGTGIGLALVKKAMERIGGRVWAESAPGRGATFFIEFPVHED